MAIVRKFSKVDNRAGFLRRLKDPEVAAAYLASVMRDPKQGEIERALTSIAEANDVEVVRVNAKTQTALESLLGKLEMSKFKSSGRARIQPAIVKSPVSKAHTARRASK